MQLLIICSTRGAESWWEVSEEEQCQTLNFLEERSIQDSLCVHWSIIPKMHTWARGRLCHFCGIEALVRLT